jgi:hypothetical protein
VRRVDEWGRVTYVCDPTYGAAPAYEPQGYAAPSYAPAPVYQARYAEPRERRGQFGLVLMPGGASLDGGDTTDAAGAVAMELRGLTGGARLRLAFEYTRYTRVAEASLKYDFGREGTVLRPFLAMGLGAARFERYDLDRDWHPTGSASAGLDLYLDKDFFVTAELKYRVFTWDRPNTGLEISSIHQTALFVGAGFYF